MDRNIKNKKGVKNDFRGDIDEDRESSIKITFNDYAEQRGLNLMNEDIKFIKNLILDMSSEQRRSTLIKYTRIWVETMESFDSHIAVRKVNAGRFAANTWLRTEGVL